MISNMPRLLQYKEMSTPFQIYFM